MKRTYTTITNTQPRGFKKRKINSGSALTSSELARVREARLVAGNMDWSALNYPIPSGSPSGLYNISTNSKEYKFVDTNLGDGITGAQHTVVGLSSAPNVFLLNGLKLGTSASQRIGNKIAMKSLYWSINLGMKWSDNNPTSSVEGYNVPVRFIIVYDKQPNGAALTLGDLLSALSGVDNTTARSIDTNSPNNLNNRERFVVVADKRMILQSGGPSARQIKKFKRLNTSVAYKSGATVGDITDITTGSLYAITFRDQDMVTVGIDSAASVLLTGDIRLRYQDD